MSSTSPRASFDSNTTTESTMKNPLATGTDAKKSSSSVTAKVKSAFGKLKSQPPAKDGASGGDKKSEVPKSVKEGSFGGEASHLRMQM